MTIKWVKVDPLVMNGEPFCYGTRLSVRNLLEMRRSGITPDGMLADNPELRRIGIAEAFRYAAENRPRYAEFFDARGRILGPGFAADEMSAFPENLREMPAGIVSTDPGTDEVRADSTDMATPLG
jgi:uncharacterized protein (DUF433 family)